MTTTIVRDSIVGDAWLQATAAAVPVQRVIDQTTGQPTGDILTGPVRLSFDTLFELPPPKPGYENPKFGATLLFTPLADFTIFYEEYYNVCAREFREYYNAQSGQYYGLHSPFRDQGEKQQLSGYTPGCIMMNCTSKYKPPVIDSRYNPIVDQSKVYPGVWAICAVSPYAYKDPRKKGVGFGLQSVMIIGDDTKFGGKAPDPQQAFAAARGAITPPSISPGVAAGMPLGAPPSAPQQPLLAPPPGGTFAPPAAPAGRPGGYAMPGAPVGDPRGPVPAGFASWTEYDDLMG